MPAYIKLFNTGVLPILNDSAEIWGFKDFKSINDIQNKAVRYFLGLHRFTPIPALCVEMGWNSLKIDRWLSMLKFWNICLQLNDNRLTTNIFEWDFDMCSVHNYDNWSSDVREILSAASLLEIFKIKSSCHLPYLVDILKEIGVINWKAEVQNKPKLRTWVSFKQDLETEKYVKDFLPKCERSKNRGRTVSFCTTGIHNL